MNKKRRYKRRDDTKEEEGGEDKVEKKGSTEFEWKSTEITVNS